MLVAPQPEKRIESSHIAIAARIPRLPAAAALGAFAWSVWPQPASIWL